jgi:hypothetical protein
LRRKLVGRNPGCLSRRSDVGSRNGREDIRRGAGEQGLLEVPGESRLRTGISEVFEVPGETSRRSILDPEVPRKAGVWFPATEQPEVLHTLVTDGMPRLVTPFVQPGAASPEDRDAG